MIREKGGALKANALMLIWLSNPVEVHAYYGGSCRNGPFCDVFTLMIVILIAGVFVVTLIDRVQKHGFVRGVIGHRGVIAAAVIALAVGPVYGGYSLFGAPGVAGALVLLLLALFAILRRLRIASRARS